MEIFLKIVDIVSEKSGKQISQFNTLLRFNPKVFIISVKSKVSCQCRSEITWPNINRSEAWFPYVWKGKLNKTDSSMKDFFICWFFFYIGCNQAAVPNVLPGQQPFPTSFCHETFQNISYCKLISISLPQVFHEGSIEDGSFIYFITRCFACMI